jgi:hypothetical protein
MEEHALTAIGNAKHVTDIRCRQAFDIPQDKYGALPGRQVINQPPDLLHQFLFGYPFVGRAIPRWRRRRPMPRPAITVITEAIRVDGVLFPERQ